MNNELTREFNWQKIITFSALILAAVAIGLSVFFYINYQKTQNMLLYNPQQAAKNELEQTIASIGKLMELPNEQPTMATVSNIDKLKSQAFFTNGQNGDKVLFYTKGRKAILYRPSINKIINVTTISVNNNAAITPEPVSASSTPTLTVSPSVTPTPKK